MNRVTAVAATLATATMAAAAAIVPAMAAPRPVAAHPAAQHAKLPAFPPTVIASELDGGKYVTVVRCHGVDSPPPIHLARPATPLTVSGVGPSAAILKMLKHADPYKNIYTCTVLVEEKVPATPKPVAKVKKAHQAGCEIMTGGRNGCAKKVTLNTGFGGLAPQVTRHHPAV
jgi:hypothetical protein